MRRSTVRDVRAAVSDAARRASTGVGLERDVARHLARAVPFDLWCGLTLDPATLLPTGGYHAQGLPAQHMPRLLEIEHGPIGDPMMDLRVLAAAAVPAQTLSAATGGDLARSVRYRDVLEPSGVRHELRAVVRGAGGAWADSMGRAVSDQFGRHGVGDGGVVVRGQPGVTRSDAPGSQDRGHRATNPGPGPGPGPDHHIPARQAGTSEMTALKSLSGEDSATPSDYQPPGDGGAGAGQRAGRPHLVGQVPAAEGDRVDHDADRWLVTKIRAGDVDAYEVLIRRHRDRIYRIALRMLGNPHDAEDIAQDVIIQLWTAMAGFTGAASFTTWLYRLVVNRCLNHKRRACRTRPLTEADHPPAVGADEAVIARQRAQAMMAVIAALPAEQRVTFVLCHVEGLSYREVATILEVSEAVVRGRLSRARRILLAGSRDWA